MGVLQSLHRLWAHSRWADLALFEAMHAAAPQDRAWREYAHVLGAEAVWLARLEERPAPVAVWPTLNPEEAGSLRAQVVMGYDTYFRGINEESLVRVVRYSNSAGQVFTTATVDILLHVALHGQYHRGKINLLLRQSGVEPVSVDYIGFVRGVRAAVTPVHWSNPGGEGAG